jgi:hypothetical protein
MQMATLWHRVEDDLAASCSEMSFALLCFESPGH